MGDLIARMGSTIWQVLRWRSAPAPRGNTRAGHWARASAASKERLPTRWVSTAASSLSRTRSFGPSPRVTSRYAVHLRRKARYWHCGTGATHTAPRESRFIGLQRHSPSTFAPPGEGWDQGRIRGGATFIIGAGSRLILSGPSQRGPLSSPGRPNRQTIVDHSGVENETDVGALEV